MPETNTNAEQPQAAAASADVQAADSVPKEPRTFTQEEVNAFLAEDRRKTAKKYEGFDALKTKLAEYESSKTDAEKLQEKVAELERANRDAVRAKVASQYGMPIELVTGETEEECVAQGEAFKKVLADAKPAGPSSKVLGNPTKGAPALNSDVLENALRTKLGIA